MNRAEQLMHAGIQRLPMLYKSVLHSAGLVPAAAPRLSPSMVNSPWLEIWSVPNEEKRIHIN